MLGRDVNSFPLQYRTWIVNDEPDLTGQLYTGLKSGSQSFVDISVTELQDDAVIADFSLPNFQSFSMIEKTLPAMASNSQLAVVDGYVYLFGGDGSDRILRAELENPADWVDTGAKLPNQLAGSQLALLDGYLYLFGGQIGKTATDNIYRAPITNPLSWVDTGANLSTALYNSQLGVADGYLYLFGGCTNNGTTDLILRAPTTNPLTWVNTGDTLPSRRQGSHLGLVDGYFYLFGGSADGVLATNTIFRSSLLTPTVFSIVGTLPESPFFGQFFTYGQYGYLITPVGTNSIEPYTVLMRCLLNNPVSWETFSNIDGLATQSQVAIIYDRIFVFGGNSSSLIFTHNLQLKYSIESDSLSQIYGRKTRTQYQSTINQLDLNKVISFPFWKTDYSW